MKRYFIYFSIIALLSGMAGCKKIADSPASADVKNPYVRQDNPNNEADHQIYLFYKATGIPVLYSDTVSKDPLETINLSYHLTTIDSLVKTKYLHQQADILTGLDFVKTQIEPYLSPEIRPYSILLTDSVYTYGSVVNGARALVPLNAYIGLKALVISYVTKIQNMSPVDLKIYRKEILKIFLTSKISQNDALIQPFFAISQAYYNKVAQGTITSPGVLIPYKPKESYGFLSTGTENPASYSTGAPLEDLARYLDVVLVLSNADFNNQYKNYPLVMQKYQILLNIFKTIGFTLA